MQPTMRCPCCKVAVHETAFHRIEKKTTFVVGESILRWAVATKALEKQDKPAIARIEVRLKTCKQFGLQITDGFGSQGGC